MIVVLYSIICVLFVSIVLLVWLALQTAFANEQVLHSVRRAVIEAPDTVRLPDQRTIRSRRVPSPGGRMPMPASVESVQPSQELRREGDRLRAGRRVRFPRTAVGRGVWNACARKWAEATARRRRTEATRQSALLWKRVLNESHSEERGRYDQKQGEPVPDGSSSRNIYTARSSWDSRATHPTTSGKTGNQAASARLPLSNN